MEAIHELDKLEMTLEKGTPPIIKATSKNKVPWWNKNNLTIPLIKTMNRDTTLITTDNSQWDTFKRCQMIQQVVMKITQCSFRKTING